MRLKKIILKNFLTYTELEYKFQDKALLVQGINLTDENQKSNGSGKSAIQTGIEFALTASNSRGVNDKELVTYGFDNSNVQLYIECSHRKETLHIDWTINVKGANKLSLKINDKDLSFSNVNDGKKQILDWLAISKEDLFNYFIINSTRFKSFFNSSNREKVDLINRFSDSSIIDGLENIDNSELELKKSEAEHNLSKLCGKLDFLKSELKESREYDFELELENEKELLNEDINLLKTKIKKRVCKKELLDQDVKKIDAQIIQKKKEIEDVKLSVGPIELEIKNKSKDLLILENQMQAQEDNVNSFKLSDFSSMRFAHEQSIDAKKLLIKENDEKIKSAKANISKVEGFIKATDVKLSGSITCPKCSNVFILDGDREVLLLKAGSAKDLLIKFEAELENLYNISKSYENEINEFKRLILSIEEKEDIERKSLRVLQDKLSASNKLLNGASSIISSLKRKSLKTSENVSHLKNVILELKLDYKEIDLDKKDHDKKISEIEDSIKELKIEIKNLKPKNNQKEIDKILENIKTVESEEKELDLKLVSINDEIYNRNKWSNNFKQFRLHLANKSLETMQFRTNEFLKELKNDIRVRFDGYKVKANGSIKEEISTVVIRDGERSFSSLSGGEQVRLLFSSILANRYLINTTHPYGGLEFLSVDECFDRIDSLGMKLLIRSATKLQTCIMIISHVSDEDLSGEEILTIVKEGGVSRIKEETL